MISERGLQPRLKRAVVVSYCRFAAFPARLLVSYEGRRQVGGCDSTLRKSGPLRARPVAVAQAEAVMGGLQQSLSVGGR